MGRVHVVGAGIAGLAAAVRIAVSGGTAVVYEAARHAGGRCRSFYDARLDRQIDNGNHLLLSGNTDAMRFLEAVGSANSVAGPRAAAFPFVDVRTGERWSVRPNAGRIPWWIASPGRRVAGSRTWHYLPGLRLALARSGASVTECVGKPRLLFERFWEPMAVGVLNTPAHAAAASLLRPVLSETFLRGEAHCRPLVAREGLSHALVNPAVALLEARGMAVRLGMRLGAVRIVNGRAQELDFDRETVSLAERDQVILALPPWELSSILPGTAAPTVFHPIVNVHFVLNEPASLPADLPLVGVVGGTVQWIFVRGDVASVTVSAASALAAESGPVIADRTWNEVARVLGMRAERLPPYRVIKEKRATFAQTPTQIQNRPGVRTELSNLFLAGAYTDTGLPATIEGAARSGHRAARLVLDR